MFTPQIIQQMEKKNNHVAAINCNNSLANAIISATTKADCCSNAAATTVAPKKVIKPYIDLKDRNGHSCHLIWKNLTSGLFYIRWFSTKRDKWVLSEEMLLHQACKRAEAMVYPGSWLDEI